jgi:hypothetical protein
LYNSHRVNRAKWQADSTAVWDLTIDEQRPYSWTSADAAGLPIFVGLVRYDEVAAGAINHALRFTVPVTRQAFTAPASHWASSVTDSNAPPMGTRLRLKASFDTLRFSPQNQVILTALKKYGMILADNGSAIYISGAPDNRWNNDDLNQLKNPRGCGFRGRPDGHHLLEHQSATDRFGARGQQLRAQFSFDPQRSINHPELGRDWRELQLYFDDRAGAGHLDQRPSKKNHDVHAICDRPVWAYDCNSRRSGALAKYGSAHATHCHSTICGPGRQGGGGCF